MAIPKGTKLSRKHRNAIRRGIARARASKAQKAVHPVEAAKQMLQDLELDTTKETPAPEAIVLTFQLSSGSYHIALADLRDLCAQAIAQELVSV